jgi:sodium-dependent dicarboxylate transporter 2/3/5
MGKGLFFALAWGCIIGGTTTILGGGRGPLAIGILEKATHGEHTISFLEYVIYDIPLVLLLGLAGWMLLRVFFRPEIDSVQPAIDELAERMRRIGKTTLREKLVGSIMVATVVLWMAAGETLGIANIAILSTALLFLLGLLSWKDVEENVNWGVLLMYGGAISLGSALADTGAALWLTERVLGDWQGSPQMLMLVLGVLTLVLTEFMSNSAVIAILMPPALTLAARYGIDPRIMTMAIVLPSNFAFMLPMATPATAIAYSSGTFAPGEAVRMGLLLNAAGLAALVLLIYVYWPLLGAAGLVAPM